MQKRMYSVAGLLVFGLVLGAVVTNDADAKGENVTFTNKGDHKVFVLAAHGGKRCTDMSEKINFELEPGAEHTVESGDSKVCYCVGMRTKVSACAEGSWKIARAGKTERLRF